MRQTIAYVVLIWLLGVARADAQSLPHGIVDVCAAPTITSVADGAWSSPSTWNPARVPGVGDEVRVAHAVTYAAVSDVWVDCVGVTGSLTFSTSATTRLTVATLYVYAAGTLTIGTAAAPVQANRLAEIVITDTPVNTSIDPEQYTTGILGFGTVEMHGAVKSPTFVRLTAERTSGQNTLPISATVSGWQAGDKLLVPDSKQWAMESFPYTEEWETPTLQSVSGQTLTISALQFGHRGARNGNDVLEYLPHVGNLSRNVVVRSANPSGTRGHVLFTHRANVDIRYALFKQLGRTTIAPLDSWAPGHVGTNQIGRYSLHIHHLMGPVTTPANGYQFTLIGNAIDDGTKWGVTVHNSHYGLIQDTVIYNAAGAGVMTEDGSESFNVFERNFVVRSRGTGEERGDSRGGWVDVGYEGSAFWFRGPNNVVRDNVGANSNSFCYTVFPMNLTAARVPKFKGADTSIAGQYDLVDMQGTPLREFARNEAYACVSAVTFWDVGADCCTVVKPVAESTVKDFVAWHISRYGYYGYGENKVTYDGWTQYGEKQVLQWSFENPQGLWFGDYITRNAVIKHADIQNVRIGIRAPFKPGDLDDIYGSAPGITRIQDSFLRNQYNIGISPMYAVTAGGASMPPRQVFVDRVSYGLVTGVANVTAASQCTICMSFAIDPRNANVIQRDEVFVTDHNGKTGDNFRAYYTQQAPSFIVPQSTSALVGAPVGGKTNAELWASHGLAIAGAVAPCSTTRADIQGFVCLTGAPSPAPPAAPTNAVLIGSEGGGSMAYANGYTYRRSVTVDDTKVSGSGDLTSFPMLVSGTYAYLATVANGGKVEHASGFDIRFETGAGTQLDHEVERWVATTGEFVAWVRIPTLDGDAPTVIFIYYGNASVSASEEDAANVWDSDYVSVVHMHNASSPATDSKLGNHGTASNAGSPGDGTVTFGATGKVGRGIDFAAGANYLSFGDITILDAIETYTSETWAKFDSLGVGRRLGGKWGGGGLNLSWLLSEDDADDTKIISAVVDGDSLFCVFTSDSGVLSTGSFHHIAIAWSAAGVRQIYFDGAPITTSVTLDQNPARIATSASDMRFGAQEDGTDSIDGVLDEFRLSKIVRSAAWIATQYNSMNDPATFYAVGSEETSGGGAGGGPLLRSRLTTSPKLLSGRLVQ